MNKRLVGSAFAVSILALGALSRAAHAVPTVRLMSVSTADATADIGPFSTINATVAITDTGSADVVTGAGTGFAPNLPFISLIYGKPSVARGPLACLPPNPNPFTPTQMVVAYWLPQTSSVRTLAVTKTGAAYVPLSMIGTMSVRYDSTPNVPPTMNQNPGRFYLQACGRVH